MANRTQLGCLTVILVLAAGIGASIGIRSFQLAPFREISESLGTIVSVPSEFIGQNEGYTAGKILTININGKTPVPDSTFFLLPENMRAGAKDKEAISTIVLMQRGTMSVGAYSNGGEALKRWVKIYIVDVKEKTITGAKEFFGGDPPKTISSGGSGTGDEVSAKEIALYIAGLPRH